MGKVVKLYLSLVFSALLFMAVSLDTAVSRLDPNLFHYSLFR